MKNGDYELIVPPEAYPGKRYRGRYSYEHHVVWWESTGDEVPRGFVVHHKNEDKRDNRIENLELLGASAHASLHGKEKKKAMIVLTCYLCGAEFERSLRIIKNNNKRAIKAGRTPRNFCCREHLYQCKDVYS